MRCSGLPEIPNLATRRGASCLLRTDGAAVRGHPHADAHSAVAAAVVAGLTSESWVRPRAHIDGDECTADRQA